MTELLLLALLALSIGGSGVVLLGRAADTRARDVAWRNIAAARRAAATRPAHRPGDPDRCPRCRSAAQELDTHEWVDADTLPGDPYPVP